MRVQMEKKPPKDDKPFKRTGIFKKDKQIKRPRLGRTIEEIFKEIQGIIDNTPSCSRTDVEAIMAVPLMTQYDDELAQAISSETNDRDSGTSDDELNEVIERVISEEESNANNITRLYEGSSDDELNDVINIVIREEESNALANTNNITRPNDDDDSTDDELDDVHNMVIHEEESNALPKTSNKKDPF